MYIFTTVARRDEADKLPISRIANKVNHVSLVDQFGPFFDAERVLSTSPQAHLHTRLPPLVSGGKAGSPVRAVAQNGPCNDFGLCPVLFFSSFFGTPVGISRVIPHSVPSLSFPGVNLEPDADKDPESHCWTCCN